MKIQLIVVGRDRSGPLLEASRDFEARIRRYVDFAVVELKEAPLRKTTSPAEVARAEADRIHAARQSGGRFVAFDRTGRSRSSEQWSERLEAWRMEGGRGVDLVIGGPVGLHAELVREADEVWSLGPLTLPHRLARVVVAEQLYRAYTILNREPYHK